MILISGLCPCVMPLLLGSRRQPCCPWKWATTDASALPAGMLLCSPFFMASVNLYHRFYSSSGIVNNQKMYDQKIHKSYHTTQTLTTHVTHSCWPVALRRSVAFPSYLKALGHTKVPLKQKEVGKSLNF